MKQQLPHIGRAACLGFLFLCFFGKGMAQPELQFKQIAQGLESPLDIKNAGDGSNRLFIVQQTGQIRIYKNGALLPTPFIDLASVVTSSGGEQGLLGLAFPPKYKQHRFFFVYYTNKSGDITIARYRAYASNPNVANPASGVILLSLPKPGGFTNHNGGGMQFGKDGYLYVTLGDGGSGGDPFGNAQNGQVLFGKMLRLDVAVPNAPYYKIPPTNPYVNDPNIRDEIWAMGLRNAWRWSFDRLTGDTWIGDVGQDKIEEIDFRPKALAKGSNYGWRCYEGNATYNTTGCLDTSNYVFPIFTYNHNFTSGGYAVIGGYVYRGDSFPALKGYYICADDVISNAWLIKSNGSGGWTTTRQGNGIPEGLAGFGEDEQGELYAASVNGGVYMVRDKNAVKGAAEDHVVVAGNNSKVYPTVVSNGLVNLDLKDAFRFVRVIDMNGTERLRKDISSTKGTMQLRLPELENGTYVLQLVGEKIETFRIVVSK